MKECFQNVMELEAYNDESRFRWKVIILAILVIISTLFWIIMMELFNNEYGYNRWIATGGGYTPYFGMIGPFIGAAFLLIGSFVKRE